MCHLNDDLSNRLCEDKTVGFFSQVYWSAVKYAVIVFLPFENNVVKVNQKNIVISFK